MRSTTLRLIRAVTVAALLLAVGAIAGIVVERRADRIDSTTYGPSRVAGASELSAACAEAFAPVSELVSSRPGAGSVTAGEEALIGELFKVCSAPEIYFIQHDVVLPWRRAAVEKS